MDALTLLAQRNSAPRLTEPGPTVEDLQTMLRCALRAPDHGYLRPTRFLTIENDRRAALGELFAQALVTRNPTAPTDEIEKNRQAPLRAPLIIVVIARLQANPKIPTIEQRLTAGCAAHSLLLAAQALGFGAIWRTGANSYDPVVRTGLQLTEDEEITGYIYVGTASAPAKPIPQLDPTEFAQAW